MHWEIIFFESPRGEKFVKEFIKSQNTSTISKIAHKIDLLETHGIYLGIPHSKKLTSELYELRVRGNQEIRIVYAFVGATIYLLHAFKKQSQKTPVKEIETALKRFMSLQ